jgi:hypothetical protein
MENLPQNRYPQLNGMVVSCGFCDQSGHDQPTTTMTSCFCDQFLKKIQFCIVTSDQFEKGDDQNWSQNQLIRLVMGWSRLD